MNLCGRLMGFKNNFKFGLKPNNTLTILLPLCHRCIYIRRGQLVERDRGDSDK
jgi:hypothetical protein